jgi:4-hydroxy-tetrahydrodipicolinate synthase
MTERPGKRLIAAMATPIGADGAPAVALLAARGHQLLAAGCDALAPFGTTGEGACFPLRQRIETVDGLLNAGIAPEQLVVSVSAMPLSDVVTLTRHAVAAEAREVLLMPLFLFRGAATEDGIFSFYSEVIARVGDPRLRIFLYHYPEISGVDLTPALIDRLAAAYPEVILGVKDSAGDLAATLSLVRAFPRLRIYTGNEVHVPDVMAAGGAGTLCGLANLMPALLRRIVDAPDHASAARLNAEIAALDGMLAGAPFAAACKAIIAGLTGEPQWRRVMPPLAPLDDATQEALCHRFIGRLETALAA